MSSNENVETEPYEDYVAVYDKARRRHAALAVEGVEVERQADVFETQGKALHQIKEFARVGFMSVPESTKEASEQLWRKAFYFGPPPPGPDATESQREGRTARV